MTPYKNMIESAKAYLSSTPFLQFLLTAGVYIFALGALFYIIDLFVYTYMILSGLGRVLMFAGLLLTLIKKEDLALVIISGVVALACLIGWIIALVGTSYMGIRLGGSFAFEPLLYFLGFGAIALFTGLKSEKFKQMRAEAAARAQYQQQQYAQQQAMYAQQQQQAQQQGQAVPPPPAAAAAPAPAPAAAAGKKCVKCGADLPADAVFCGACGTKQE